MQCKGMHIKGAPALLWKISEMQTFKISVGKHAKRLINLRFNSNGSIKLTRHPLLYGNKCSISTSVSTLDMQNQTSVIVLVYENVMLLTGYTALMA